MGPLKETSLLVPPAGRLSGCRTVRTIGRWCGPSGMFRTPGIYRAVPVERRCDRSRVSIRRGTVDEHLWVPVEPLLSACPEKAPGRCRCRCRCRTDSACRAPCTCSTTPLPGDRCPFETGSGSDRTCWRRLDRRQKAGIFFSRLELGHGTRPARVSRMIVLRVLGRRAGLRTARTAYRRPGPVFPFQPDPAAATAQAAVGLTGQPCPWAAVEWRVGRVSSCRRGLGWSADG